MKCGVVHCWPVLTINSGLNRIIILSGKDGNRNTREHNGSFLPITQPRSQRTYDLMKTYNSFDNYDDDEDEKRHWPGTVDRSRWFLSFGRRSLPIAERSMGSREHWCSSRRSVDTCTPLRRSTHTAPIEVYHQWYAKNDNHYYIQIDSC